MQRQFCGQSSSRKLARRRLPLHCVSLSRLVGHLL